MKDGTQIFFIEEYAHMTHIVPADERKCNKYSVMLRMGENMKYKSFSEKSVFIEKPSRKEGDDKRHRSRCAYYTKREAHCSQYYEKCHGASHCPYYKEMEDKQLDLTDLIRENNRNI